MRPVPPVLLAGLLGLSALIASGALAWAASVGGPSLTLRGRALAPGGAPIGRVRVTLEGGQRLSVTADDSGRFVLRIPLPDRASLEHGTRSLHVWAAAKGWHFETEDRQASVGLELQIETGRDSVRRVVARSNDSRFGAAAAGAVASGSAAELAGLVIVGRLGDQLGAPPMPSLGTLARVALSSGGVAAAVATPVPAVAMTSAPAAPATSHSAAAATTQATPRHDSTTTSRPTPGASTAAAAPVTRPVPPPGMSTPAPPTTAPAPTGAAVLTPHSTAAALPERTPAVTAVRDSGAGCHCRVVGTVEMNSPVLTTPLRVEFGIEGLASPRDTVELYMGSPRPFTLLGVPCGDWRLRVTPLSRKHYGVVDSQHVLALHCGSQRLLQPRVVLAPH